MRISEREPRILFDQMLAYYVRKGFPIVIDSQEFQKGLMERFIERDGMFFLPDQAAEYDKKRMTTKELVQIELFISDEANAIQWLRQKLIEKPMTFQELQPVFMKELSNWKKHEVSLELKVLLEQNFLTYDGTGEVPSQIHSYLSHSYKEFRKMKKTDLELVKKAKGKWYVPDSNKIGDLEKLRERALLKEFNEYKTVVTKKMKVFRLEAVRAGFKKAWMEKDYEVIISIAKKLPEDVLQEDEKLLMWYDQALTRTGKG